MPGIEANEFSPELIETQVTGALSAAQLYDIGSYGWLNENDADPEYIGHAMWQTDQPQLDLHALLGDAPVRRRPRELEKLILTLGEDFCGLMQVSRLSLGLALLSQSKATRDVLNETQFFWLHHTDTFLKLAIASDRLRDLLVVACTGGAPDDYKKLNRRNRLYVTPFEDAGSLLAGRGFTDQRAIEPIGGLPAKASAIFSFIDRRNEIVHAIATRMARSAHVSVTRLQHDYDRQQQAHGFSPLAKDYAEWRPRAEARMQELRDEIASAVRQLADWYRLLIDTSNLVFQVEYWTRTLASSTDA